MTIQIACDGSCIQSGTFRIDAIDREERPSAAGFVALMANGVMVSKAEAQPDGAIGGMEVKALRMGLEFAARTLEHLPETRSETIRIVCDSQYVVNGFNDWLPGWAAKNYHKKGGLANAAEWRVIDDLKASLGRAVTVEWTKGHANHRLNNLVDERVNGSARSQVDHDDTHLAFPDALNLQPAAVDADIVVSVTETDAAGDATAFTTSPVDGARDDASTDAPGLPWNDAAPVTNHTVVDHSGGFLDAAIATLHDPEIAGFVAAAIETALEERRMVARFPQDVVDAVELLRLALDRHANEPR